MIPSKNDLKNKYNITDDDFQILTNFPSTSERSKTGGFFIKVGEAIGGHEWMWKSWTGRLIAVIVLTPLVAQTVEFWNNTTVRSYNTFSSYLQSFSPEDDTHPKGFVAFYPQAKEQLESTSQLDLYALPLGSGLFPASEKWLA